MFEFIVSHPIWFALLAITILGAIARSIESPKDSEVYGGPARRELKEVFDEEVRRRLMLISGALNGNIIDGPAIETLRGRLYLQASGAPMDLDIDLVKFSAPTGIKGSLTVVRIEDLKKVIATKSLRRIGLDPAIAERYAAFASDESKGRRWLSPEVVEKLRALETAVRARARIQMANGTLSILAFRGLAKTDELRAFYEGAVAVADALEASAG